MSGVVLVGGGVFVSGLEPDPQALNERETNAINRNFFTLVPHKKFLADLQPEMIKPDLELFDSPFQEALHNLPNSLER